MGNGVRLQGGVIRIKPGEFQPVETTGGTLRDNIFPYPFKEPSSVLFNLLGLLTDAGMKLAAVSETMTGEMPGQNTPATTVLAMIEQGLKVFTAIYKRVFRSLKEEYKKLYRLNRLYMDEQEYINILDDSKAIFAKDYDLNDLDITPVADPTVSSEAQRLARAQALMSTMGQNPTMGGKLAILSYFYDAVTGNPELTAKLLPEQELNAEKPPDTAMLELQLRTTESQTRMQMEQQKLNIERVRAEAEIEATFAKAEKMSADAMKALADAEAVEVGQQFEQYRVQLKALADDLAEWKANTDAKVASQGDGTKLASQGGVNGNTGGNDQGRAAGMEGAANNPEGVPAANESEGPVPSSANEGGIPIDGIGGEDSLANLRATAHDLRAEQNP